MTILGIDTSFDDTAAAVVQNTTVLSNVLSSQLPAFQEYGGVVPRLARLNHEQHIDQVIAAALKRAGVSWDEIDAIAVTQGPGLAITLEVGITKAKALATLHHKRLIAINHLEGHLLSFLAHPLKKPEPKLLLPALAILVSGGNTQFVLVKTIGSYQVLGQTQDDAMGEAFDKVGRMLGLGYPAGALVEKLAKSGRLGKIIFPIPMRTVKSSNTSFSGLKTAASRVIDSLKTQKNAQLTKQDIADVALGFQTACITHLIEKASIALASLKVKTLIAGGGVVSNLALRGQLRQLAKQQDLTLLLPYSKKLCVDNAVMIAICGYFKASKHEFIGDFSLLDRLPNARLAPTSLPHSN